MNRKKTNLHNILVVRHGIKIDSERCKYLEDNALSADGIIDIKNKFFKLLSMKEDDKYLVDVPEKIITSPFLRCMETSLLIQKIILMIRKQYIDIKVDSQLRSYLGNDTSRLREETRKLLREDNIKKDNLEDYILNVKNYVMTNNTWYITHSFFVDIISEKYGMKDLIIYSLKEKYRPEEATGIFFQ